VQVFPREGYEQQVEDVLTFARDVAAEVNAGAIQARARHGLRAQPVPASLFRPLLALDDRPPLTIRCHPVALNPGEAGFVDAVERFLGATPALLCGARVHLLRNQSRRGLGFFVGEGFYPDFIVWVEKEGVQRVVFVDPKGLAHAALRSTADKFLLPQVLWEIERRNALPDVRLDAFLVSQTRRQDLDPGLFSRLPPGCADRILFHDDPDCAAKLFTRALGRD
jgi:hypothetical protein